jgi:type III pantothenate kinase
MILAIDIGNSNIVVAVYANHVWTRQYRFETKEPQPSFYYASALRQILLESSLVSGQLENIVISSVVPELNSLIRDAVQHVTGKQPLFLVPELFLRLDMPVPHPYEIGSDIVANAYGALKSYGDHCLIVDFGTALTFTAASTDNGIIGVTIAPGVQTALQSLALQTAQLPVVPALFPSSALGHDTITAIQAGVMWGYVGLVKEMIHRIKAEIGPHFVVIATGGLSGTMSEAETLFDHRNVHLTLDGMRHIASFISSKGAQ